MDFSRLLVWLFDLLAHLPLSALHRIGAALGWVAYWSSKSYAKRLRENLLKALQLKDPSNFDAILHSNISEAGKAVLELTWIWRRPLNEVVASVNHCEGLQHVEAAYAKGKGVIILTPHLGCFDLISTYIASRWPMTSMYRRPRWKFLDVLMQQGRERGNAKLVPADVGGVRHMLKALRQGNFIGVLPDQVPGNGEGEWLPFFGRPAYTMTLIGRLVESSGATPIMTLAIRAPHGKGYTLKFVPLTLSPNESAALQINRALEEAIYSCPEQYLWSYNRYKVPNGVAAPNVQETNK